MKALTEATAKLLSPAQGLLPSDHIYVELNDEGDKFICKCMSSAGSESRYPSSNARRFMYRYPERQLLSQSWTTGDTWLIGATDQSAEIFACGWPKDQITFDEESRTLYTYLYVNTHRQDIAAEIAAEFKTHRVMPKHDWELHSELTLSPYQQVALHNSMRNEGYALFMEQGTGKTAVVIARVMNEAARKERRNDKDVYRVLIVCPRQVRLNWQNEFIRFATRQGSITRVHGGQIQRVKMLIDAMKIEPGDEYSVVIINYETLSSSWDAIRMIPWDLAVLDESHSIKNPNTKRSKYSHRLRDNARSRMCLTGTPIANTPMDLYSQFEFLGENWSGFTSYHAFREFYGVFEDRRNSGIAALIGFQNLPFLQERLARKSFIITKKEALPDLPDKVYDLIEVEMTEQQQDVYEQVATQLAVEIENELSGETETALVINNVLTKLLRLSQITAGFLKFDTKYDDDGNIVSEGRIDRFDPNPKVETVIEILKEKEPHQKTIIWSCYVECIRQLAARCKLEGIEAVTFYGETSDDDRDEAVRRFNEDDSCKVFIGNPTAGGSGLNLIGYPPGNPDASECNVDHEIYFVQNWSAVARSQSEDRAHRRGTRTNIRISDLVVPDSIDEEIAKRVKGKIEMAMKISDVREILANVFKDLV